MGGGAWLFLVGGVICLVNSVNERDLNLLNSYVISKLQVRVILQFLILNEEFLVSASHQLALITSLPFVTHRPSLLPIEWFSEAFGSASCIWR
eukprot:Pgem_evm1s12976